MSKEKKQKLLLSVLVSCIVLVGYYYLLIQPKLSRLGTLIPELRQAKEALALTKEELSRQEQLQRRLDELNEKVKKYEKAFPSESDLSALLNYLSSQARASDVTLVGVEPQQENKDAGGIFQEVLLTLRARGGYHPLGHFLNLLETGERMIAVEAFELTADPGNPRDHPMRLNLKTYVARE